MNDNKRSVLIFLLIMLMLWIHFTAVLIVMIFPPIYLSISKLFCFPWLAKYYTCRIYGNNSLFAARFGSSQIAAVASDNQSLWVKSKLLDRRNLNLLKHRMRISTELVWIASLINNIDLCIWPISTITYPYRDNGLSFTESVYILYVTLCVHNPLWIYCHIPGTCSLAAIAC